MRRTSARKLLERLAAILEASAFAEEGEPARARQILAAPGAGETTPRERNGG